MQSTSTLFERELRKILDEEVSRQSDLLLQGTSVSDYAEYKYQLGKLQALKNIYEYIDEVSNKLKDIL